MTSSGRLFLLYNFSETVLLLFSHALCHQQVLGVHFKLKALSILQQLNSLLRWSTTWLTERLPLCCPSHWAQSGWIWLAAVITSIFQNELHLMTTWDILNAWQCFPVQVSDDAVQQRLCSSTVYRENISKNNVFGNGADIIRDSNVLSIVHTARHARLPQAATKMFTEFTPTHYVVTSISVSHMALYVLMHVVTTFITLPECVHQLAKLHQ